MLRALLFLAGVGLIVTGVAMLAAWAAFIVGGAALAGFAALLERQALRREANEPTQPLEAS